MYFDKEIICGQRSAKKCEEKNCDSDGEANLIVAKDNLSFDVLAPIPEVLSPIEKYTVRRKYRVEAFIVPRIISDDDLSTTNEIDDVKIANSRLKLNSPLKSVESLADESKIALTSSPLKKIEDDDPHVVYDVEEPIYDVPCVVMSKSTNLSSQKKYEEIASTLPPKIPARTSSLMSIDERGENDGILEEFCFHGLKNGCTASTQRPEQVSEEIFQDNWLRRLEILREREASISEKETILQERERLLFKKERELRILERLVREKLKEAELLREMCRSSQSIESRGSDLRTKSSESIYKSQIGQYEKSTNSSKQATTRGEEKEKFHALDTIDKEQRKIERLGNDENYEKGHLRNPPNSRSSLWTSSVPAASFLPRKDRFVGAQMESSRNSFPVSAAYSSLRISSRPKVRPKISYDDLDSTLSADIGDSSFVVTSRKFDPAVFKKPHAFARSSSERRAKLEFEDVKRPQHVASQRNTFDDKSLKRPGDNLIINHDDNIKYQDYGLIDERVDTKENEEARNSYLNLERGFDAMKSEKISNRNSRDRPNSWNEESNEWLRKKRQAYNMATLRMSCENFENKENADTAINGHEKLKKTAKKKDSRTKKFGIFR